MTEDDFIKVVANNIRRIRLEKSIKQSEVADLCDFERSNLRRIESGKNNLTLRSLYKISKALGVDISDLIKGK